MNKTIALLFLVTAAILSGCEGCDRDRDWRGGWHDDRGWHIPEGWHGDHGHEDHGHEGGRR